MPLHPYSRIGMFEIVEFLTHVQGSVDLRGWEANKVRGALGHTLRRVACPTGARTCANCSIAQLCAYSYCFETEAHGDGRFHSAGQDVPRPYIIRAVPMQASEVKSGIVAFDIVLLGRATEYLPYFVLAVKDWENEHAGPGHSTTRLIAATAFNPLSAMRSPIYKQGDGQLQGVPWRHTLETLRAAASLLPSDELTIRFTTPTRIKRRGNELSRPDFAAVIATLARRAEALQEHHGLPDVVGDGRALVKAAEAVQLVSWEGDLEARERYSSRQKQTMRMEGFVGTAVYRGDLTPFLPLLKLGEIIHVGKGAVFGLGRMVVGGQS